MNIKLLTEQHLEFLSLKGGCTGLSKSNHVKMPHCWKSHVTAHMYFYFILGCSRTGCENENDHRRSGPRLFRVSNCFVCFRHYNPDFNVPVMLGHLNSRVESILSRG